MKVLHLCTYDIYGGAARAAFRLHKSLRENGVDSYMLVLNKGSDDIFVEKLYESGSGIKARILAWMDHLPLKMYKWNKNDYWSVGWQSNSILNRIKKINPDIINMHWVGQGLISIKNIQSINRPIVWTMHDMWPFTGGCHYSGDCVKYKLDCGSCVKLNSNSKFDLSYKFNKRKSKAVENSRIFPVAPSNWIYKKANESKIFGNLDMKLIHYGIDLELFKPLSKSVAREILNVSPEKKVICFGAVAADSDLRKGWKHLLESIKILTKNNQKQDIELLIFGTSQSTSFESFGLKVNTLGVLKDEYSLVLAYSAADVFLAPSLEDNLPNTVIESLSCGTPVVAFDIGGMSDMIDHELNGYLAKPFKDEDLVRGLELFLTKEPVFSENARKKALNSFDSRNQSIKYLDLYKSIQSS